MPMLPNNWLLQPISEFGDIVTGTTPSTKREEYYGGPYKLISPADLNDSKYVATSHRLITDKGLSVSRILPRDSILVGCIGNVGKTALTADEMSASNQQINAIICNKSHSPHFVYYLMVSARSLFEKTAVKTTLPILNKSNFRRIELPVPPLPEQKAIAHVLSTVQLAIEKQAEILRTLAELKRALMNQLFTHGTRGEPTKQTEIGKMPESWPLKRIDDVFETQLGKMLSEKARRGKTPLPYLRNRNVQWGCIETDDLAYMDFDQREATKFRLRKGDLLVCEGGVVGRAAIWKGEIEECYYQKALHRLRPKNTEVTNEFLAYWLSYAFELTNIYGITGASSTIAHLPEITLKALRVPIPGGGEQDKIVRIFGAIDSKIELVEKKKSKLELLFRTLLNELMTGRIRVNISKFK
jgi:type I restriction enzyme S subunit